MKSPPETIELPAVNWKLDKAEAKMPLPVLQGTRSSGILEGPSHRTRTGSRSRSGREQGGSSSSGGGGGDGRSGSCVDGSSVTTTIRSTAVDIGSSGDSNTTTAAVPVQQSW